MRGFASWTRVPVVTTTSGRKGEPKGDSREMERDGWIGREREREKEREGERERNGRGSGRVRNAKRRKVRRGWKKNGRSGRKRAEERKGGSTEISPFPSE